MNSPALLIRPSTAADLPRMAAIYGQHVLYGTGTFELEPPSDRRDGATPRRRAGEGLPWLVAERAGTVVGFAYANHFRPRPAYRFCLEDSIYLGRRRTRPGRRPALLAELLARCEALGARQMLAVIGDSDNPASIGVHRALGFEHDRRSARQPAGNSDAGSTWC